MFETEKEIRAGKHFQVLVVWGKMSAEGLKTFEDKLAECLTAETDQILIDFQQCPYLSSRIFPSLLNFQDKANAQDIGFSIVLSDALLDIFRITRLDRRLRLFTEKKLAFEAKGL